MANNQNRTRGAGTYTFEGGLARACGCGHTLGDHDGERAKIAGVNYQPCQADGCECECFKPLRAKQAAK